MEISPEALWALSGGGGGIGTIMGLLIRHFSKVLADQSKRIALFEARTVAMAELMRRSDIRQHANNSVVALIARKVIPEKEADIAKIRDDMNRDIAPQVEIPHA